MAIVEMFLVNSEGMFGLDKKEYTLEWLVFSDNQRDFAQAIALQGTIADTAGMIGPKGEATGWYSPGTPYGLGNEWNDMCYAGAIEVRDRQIIRGSASSEINGDVFTITANKNPVIQWRVRQTYSTENDPKLEPDELPSENDPFTFSMSYEWEEVPFMQDIVDKYPVVNSAGMLFNPPAATRRKLPIFSITRRENWNPVNKGSIFTNTINRDFFYGCAPGTLLMDSIVPHFDGQTWTVSYNLKERIEGWETYLLERIRN